MLFVFVEKALHYAKRYCHYVKYYFSLWNKLCFSGEKLFFLMENVISPNGKKAMFHCEEMLVSIMEKYFPWWYFLLWKKLCFVMEKVIFHYGKCYFSLWNKAIFHYWKRKVCHYGEAYSRCEKRFVHPGKSYVSLWTKLSLITGKTIFLVDKCYFSLRKKANLS